MSGDIVFERKPKLAKSLYESELNRLQRELVKLQEWVRHEGLRSACCSRGDAAGKGGTIKRITERTNPGWCGRRARQAHRARAHPVVLPALRRAASAGGEIVLFDRSWYNRAGVERVMGFCTDDEYHDFLRACAPFEDLLIRSGMVLVKYWFSVSDEEQERRFQDRISNPEKRWKLSPMDLESRTRWADYSRAKDTMFVHTDTPTSPWWVVHADDKKRARLNCISHLLAQVPYEDLTSGPIVELPERPKDDYRRPKLTHYSYVPDAY
ncbi:MAG: polyphosphate kinase 2 [Acidimicrobiales bacterium]